MTFRDEPEIRATIQKTLRDYMAHSSKSSEQVADYIRQYRADIAPDAKKGRAAIDHGTVARFLQDWQRTRRQSVEILYHYLVHIDKISDPDVQFRNRPATDPVFRLMQHFFGVRERNLELCRSLVGTYSLFFRSEDRRSHVVVGANWIRSESGC